MKNVLDALCQDVSEVSEEVSKNLFMAQVESSLAGSCRPAQSTGSWASVNPGGEPAGRWPRSHGRALGGAGEGNPLPAVAGQCGAEIRSHILAQRAESKPNWMQKEAPGQK